MQRSCWMLWWIRCPSKYHPIPGRTNLSAPVLFLYSPNSFKQGGAIMVRRKQIRKRPWGLPQTICLSLCANLLITLLGAALTAYLMVAEKIGEGSAMAAAAATALLASASGAVATILLVTQKRLQMCLLSGGCYFAALLIITAAVGGGRFSGIGIIAGAIFAGCMMVALLGNIPKGKGYHRKH